MSEARTSSAYRLICRPKRRVRYSVPRLTSTRPPGTSTPAPPGPSSKPKTESTCTILASGSRKERLRSVKAPTLVIHGTIDPLVHPEGGKDTAVSIPGAKLLMIEGMGHALPIPMWPEIIDAIDKHGAFIWNAQARKQRCHGGFSCPRRPDEGNRFARLNL